MAGLLRILWLKTELLHPVDKGGRIRTYNMLRELKRDHEITYLALDDGAAGAEEKNLATEYSHELICVPHRTAPKFSPGFYRDLVANLASPLPYFMKKYESKGMRREIERLLKEQTFDVMVCDFLQPSVNVPANLDVATVLFQHNVEAMIWKRHYEVHKNPLKRAFLYDQWRKTWRYERSACQRFDLVVAVSAADEQQMRDEYGLKHAAAVPTGVDIDYFNPSGTITPDKHNIVFTGSMDWLPNEDAMQYFIREVLPLVRKEIPDVTLTVVGRNPYVSLVELSKSDKSIVVTGRVDDVRPYIEKAAVYVVPIRIGGGTRLKIYEAMSMGKPVVSTTVGAEGLPVTNNEELVLADYASDFAAALIRVFRDRDWAAELGGRAAKLVREKFGWRGVAESFAALCAEAAHSPQKGTKSTQK
jgi:glycosyltransferase involved in cell wall biosynthesis